MQPRRAETTGSLSGTTAGHYEIHERVGAGGMGEVYRARDKRLNRTVAVKVQSERLVRNEIARARFIRETRLAAQVTHAYVATVLDVVEQGDLLLLVMEFIEGRTLAEVIREDPPDARTRLRYGVEIAEALHAIHKAGLVHRDLKPANVMITADDHVKVTDFGLARETFAPMDAGSMLSTETQLTQPGAVVGTALYMSPEQLRHESMDQRSDLFSYGIVFYELLTGRHPFARQSAQDSISAILHEPPDRSDLPPILAESRALRTVLLKSLEKDPDSRYQSSEELLRGLKEAHEAALHGRRTAPASGLTLLAAVALCVAVATGVWWVNRPLIRDEPRIAVAVVPLQDRTGESGENARGLMAADLLATALESSSLVRAVGPSETSSLVRGLPLATEPSVLARRVLSGITADYVAVGSLYREGDLYLASVNLIPARAELPELRPLEVRAASVSLLADRLSWALKRSLPSVSTLTAWRDDRTEVEEITSSSDEARMLYERGSLALVDGRLGEAIDRFETAVGLDPSFAMGHARLALALRAAGYGRRSREAATRARDLSPAPDTRAAERLALTLGAVRARVFDRTDEAVEAWGELARSFPDEPAIAELFARALDSAGRREDALAEIDRALALDGLRAPSHLARAEILEDLKRFEDGFRALDEAERLYRLLESDEGLAEVDYVRGRILIDSERFAEAQGSLDEAARRFTEAGSEPRVAKVLLEAARSEIVRGEVLAGEAKLARACEIAERFGNRGLIFNAKAFEGAARYQRGDLEAAEALLREATDLGLQIENDRVVETQVNLGSLLNYAGRLDEARSLLTTVVATAKKPGFEDELGRAERTLADIDYQLGQLDAAIGAYDEMIRASAGQPPDKSSTRPHLRLAQIYERRGEPDRALAEADIAVLSYRALRLPGDLGYALFWRARVYGTVGRLDEARRDLAEARAIATAPAAGLADLEAKCDLAEAVLEAHDGRWAVARALAERAVESTRSGSPADRILALEVLCRGALAQSPAGAVERCTAGAKLERVPAADRVHAEALLGEALWKAGRSSAAREVATAAYEAASRMALHLPVARSAAVLLSLAGDASPADSEKMRESGRAALARFLDSAAGAGGADVRNQQEIRWLSSVLGDPGATASQESKGGFNGQAS